MNILYFEEYCDTKVAEIEAVLNEKSLEHIDNFSVHSGWLGLSLFYSMLATYKQDDGSFVTAEKYLDKGLSMSSPKNYVKRYPTDSYDNQLAHMGIYLLFCQSNGFLKADIDPMLQQIESTLLVMGTSKIVAGDFSQFSGALAAAKYFLHNGKLNDSIKLFFKDLVQGLAKNAQRDEEGDMYWESPLLKNRVYLGISHGSSMVIVYLCCLLEKGFLIDQCSEILHSAVRYVLKQERQISHGLFPIVVGDSEGPTQFTQCYGDLGIAYALLRAGQVLKDHTILAKADKILRHCTERQWEDGYTGDAGMTYGASGLSQFFRKIASIANEPELYYQASEYWCRQIVRYERKDSEYAGFLPVIKDFATRGECFSYDWGLIGISMSLMKFRKPDIPDLHHFNMYI